VVKKPEEAQVLVVAKTDCFSKEFKRLYSDLMVSDWECESYEIKKKIRDEYYKHNQKEKEAKEAKKTKKKKILTTEMITLNELLSLVFLWWSNQKDFYIRRDKYRVFKEESTIDNSFCITPYQKNYHNVLYLHELTTFDPNPDYNPDFPLSNENPRLLIPKICLDAPAFSSIFMTTSEKEFIDSIASSKLAAYKKLLAKKKNPKFKVWEEFPLDKKFHISKDNIYLEKMQQTDWEFYHIDKIWQELTGQKEKIPEVKDWIYFPNLVYTNFNYIAEKVKNQGAKVVRKQSYYFAIYGGKSIKSIRMSLKKGDYWWKTQKEIEESETNYKQSSYNSDEEVQSLTTQEDISDEGTPNSKKLMSPTKKRDSKSKRKAKAIKN
jgi:hypothetical protein